jgi:TPR repeat protein
MVRSCPAGASSRRARRLAFVFATLWPLAWAPAAAQDVPSGTGLGWFESAARAGDAEAQYRLGSILERGTVIEGIEGEPGIVVRPDPAAARQWYEAAAAQGHVEAQFKLGLLYQSGRLGHIDLDAAARWYEAAAGQGLPQAMFNLAVILVGQGGVGAMARAVELYRGAAGQGFGPAAYELGLLYREGNGVEADPVQAYVWLERAVRLGVQSAQQVRDDVGRGLSAAQMSEARSRFD